MDSLICAALRGERTEWSATEDISQFLYETRTHGVQPLLYHMLQQSGSLRGWPDPVQRELKDGMRLEAIQDAIVENELPRALETLAAAGIRCILLKGTPLACTHYPRPGLRPRGDTDLLIDFQDLPALEAALKPHGYVRFNAVTGKLVSNQCILEGRITLDVHWKLFNPPMLSRLLSMDELAGRRVSVPALGPHAFAACPVDALLIGCVHRIGHHHDDMERLIWLYDIHLLVQQMTAAEFEAFCGRAAEKQVRALCLNGLHSAQRCFNTSIPPEPVRRYLQTPEGASEPTALLLQPNLNRFDLMRLDFAHVHGWDRFRLLREHLLPPPSYMLQKYNASAFLLPWLYTRRALSGIYRLLRSR